jgi:hypothetical protein
VVALVDRYARASDQGHRPGGEPDPGPVGPLRRKGLTQDPGQSLNADSLRELYRLGGGTGDLARVRYAVNEHGELGPLLTRAGQAFRGPDDIAA